jgi:hypothetical protein
VTLRTTVALALFAALAGTTSVSAQGAKAPPTKTDAKTAPPASAAAKTATKSGPQASPATKTGAPAAPAAGTKQKTPGLSVATEPLPPRPVSILREAFVYDGGGRRDPFLSLLTTTELRPLITDLKLVGVVYDESGLRHVAILREAGTNVQYRVTTGTLLGRLRVALIKRKAVIFSIEEFGLNRQDSLVIK